MNDNLIDVLLDENRFPYEGISLEERNFCLEILKSCKDICDSDNKINGSSVCQIIELYFKKDGKKVNANGSLSLGNVDPEYRVIDADIYIGDDSILVEMSITRLKAKDGKKFYKVSDIFKMENGNLIRASKYDYSVNNIYSNIESNEMKGRLK